MQDRSTVGRRPISRTLTALILAAALAGCSPGNPQIEPQDDGNSSILIQGVRIVDGTGAAAFAGDVRISGETIADVGKLEARSNDQLFDGRGLTLAPGFIDTHSHAERDVLEQPDALPALSQGITTVIVGQDGGSQLPLSGFFSQLEESPVSINIASYAGHNVIRSKVLGKDYRRKASAAEIDEMAAIFSGRSSKRARWVCPAAWSTSREFIPTRARS